MKEFICCQVQLKVDSSTLAPIPLSTHDNILIVVIHWLVFPAKMVTGINKTSRLNFYHYRIPPLQTNAFSII